MDNLLVRPIQKGDLLAVKEFWEQVELVSTAPNWIKGKDVETIIAEFDSIKRKIAEIIGVFLDQELVGFVEFVKRDSTFIGHCFAIKPSYQHTQIAGEALKKVYFIFLADKYRAIDKIVTFNYPPLISYYRRFGNKWKNNTNCIMENLIPLIYRSGILQKDGFHILDDLSYHKRKDYDGYFLGDLYVYEYCWHKKGQKLKLFVTPEPASIIGVEYNKNKVLFSSLQGESYCEFVNVSLNPIKVSINDDVKILLSDSSGKIRMNEKILSSATVHIGDREFILNPAINNVLEKGQKSILTFPINDYVYEVDLNGLHLTCYDKRTDLTLFENLTFKFGETDFFPWPIRLPSDIVYSYEIESDRNDQILMILKGTTTYFGHDLDISYRLLLADGIFKVDLSIGDLYEDIEINTSTLLDFQEHKIHYSKDGMVYTAKDEYLNSIMQRVIFSEKNVDEYILTDQVYFKRVYSDSKYIHSSKILYYNNDLIYTYKVPSSKGKKKICSFTFEFGPGNLLTTLEDREVLYLDHSLLEMKFNIPKEKLQAHSTPLIEDYSELTMKEYSQNGQKLIEVCTNTSKLTIAPNYNMGVISYEKNEIEYINSYFPHKRSHYRCRYVQGGISPHIYAVGKEVFPGTLDQLMDDVVIEKTSQGIKMSAGLNNYLQNIHIKVEYSLLQEGLLVKIKIENKSNMVQYIGYLLRYCLSKKFGTDATFEYAGNNVKINKAEILSTRNRVIIKSNKQRLINVFHHIDLANKRIDFGRVNYLGTFIDNHIKTRLKPGQVINLQSSLIPLKDTDVTHE